MDLDGSWEVDETWLCLLVEKRNQRERGKQKDEEKYTGKSPYKQIL